MDEFLLTPLVAAQPTDLLNMLERRYQDKSRIICTQYRIQAWRERLNPALDEEPLCEAILDRIVPAAQIVGIGGEISMREHLRNVKIAEKGHSDK